MEKKLQKEILEIVKSGYQEKADNYNAARSGVSLAKWENLKKITDDIKDGQAVLDAGCGNGWLIDLIGEKQIAYLGIDQDETLLSHAQKKYPNHEFVRDYFGILESSLIG